MGTCWRCGALRPLQVVRVAARGGVGFIAACALCVGLLVAQESLPVPPPPTPTITWPGTPSIGPPIAP